MYSGAAIGVGRVAERVLAVDGQPQVRTSVWLTLALDHLCMDGRVAGELLAAVVAIIESDELVQEALVGAEATHEVPVLPAANVA